MSEIRTIPKWWRAVAITGWAILSLFTLVLYAASIAPRFHELTVPCTSSSCNNPYLLSAEDAAILADWGIPLTTYAAYEVALDLLVFVALFGIGLVIIRFRSHEWIGITTSLVMIVGAVGATESTGALALANPAWLLPSAGLEGVAFVLVGVFMITFPNGRLFPRWSWIVVALFSIWLTGVFLVNPTAILIYSESMPILIPAAIYVACIFIFQVVRYFRVATRLEQQQTKVALLVFLIGSLSIPILFVLDTRPILLTSEADLLYRLGGGTIQILLGLSAPVGIGLAILRFRLWDIDFVIRRTLTYGIITTLLAGIYVGAVALLQRGFVQITGQQSALAVVISTLGIAALFNPIRHRVQEIVDRRFNRRRYNAEQTLEGFAEAMRDDVDMDHLSAALIGVVEETMQPESVGLWLGQSDNKKGY